VPEEKHAGRLEIVFANSRGKVVEHFRKVEVGGSDPIKARMAAMSSPQDASGKGRRITAGRDPFLGERELSASCPVRLPDG
jgi:hypothetical protein